MPTRESPKLLDDWLPFAGGVLVVAVLYWAQALIVPLAVAALLTFLLSPLATGLERWVGRVPAVLAVVALTFVLIGGAGFVLTRQMGQLEEELPLYRDHILQKAAEVRRLGSGGSVEKLQQTVEEIQTEILGGEASDSPPAQAVVVTPEQVDTLWRFPTLLGPLLEPLATGLLVVILVIFMLLERRDLRVRLISLFGHGHLAVTTRAFDEAASRVSRFLLLQTLVNATFGVGVAIGLSVIGVPHALLLAAMAAVFRFIPYVGPWVGAGIPIVISLAALSGWERPLMVVALFVGLELFTNFVLETFWYAGAAGVSQVGLLIAVAFWTWLWGSMGLLLAMPLTVCLVVLGKHVTGLEFISTLMADRPPIPPDVAYYQRILARDQVEAAELIDRHARTHSPESVYDALLLPALNYAERDRLDGRLSPEEEVEVIRTTRDLMLDAEEVISETGTSLPPTSEEVQATAAGRRVTVLGYPCNSDGDEVALRLLQHALTGTPIAVDVVSHRLLASELIARVKQSGARVIVLADLPPSAASKSKYLVKKLRASLPDVSILVGRWAPPALRDDTPAPLLEAGAHHVGSTLLETRTQLQPLAQHLLQQSPQASSSDAA